MTREQKPDEAEVQESNLVVRTTGLARTFGELKAVDDLHLAVEAGTIYGFLGRNGAGKSTTIKLLTGLLEPTSGVISLLGGNPLDPAEAVGIKRRVGVVPENLALFDLLTAREYLTFTGRMYLMERDTIDERTDELLAVLDLADRGKKLVTDFSHGMRKKLALAAALLPNPELLILDEPFEGIDVLTARTVRDLLTRLVDRGSTVFITSHGLEAVERLCTHVGIIDHGHLVHQGPLAELREGSSLEERFVQRVGAPESATGRLRWLDR